MNARTLSLVNTRQYTYPRFSFSFSFSLYLPVGGSSQDAVNRPQRPIVRKVNFIYLIDLPSAHVNIRCRQP